MLLKKATILFFLVILCAAAGVFLNARGEDELKQQVAELRREVERLKRTEIQVTSLRQDIAALQQNAHSDKKNKDAISNTLYLPDGSHMDDPYLGNRDSAVLVMAFIDYQCRPCRRFVGETFPQLKSQYIDTGKIKFVFRDFPLSTNKQAQAAGSLAHCAGEQGAYWEMSELLFANAEELDQGEIDKIGKRAPILDNDKLTRCVSSERYLKEMEQDVQEGIRLGAKGAPGFFVGNKNEDGSYRGVFIRGAQPFPVIEAQIKRALG